MRAELDQLAERISRLATLTHELREENQQLRQQLLAATADTRSLKSRLDAARQRIEALIDKLPIAD
jgi:outer membrane murein-binding lipoprotein Lpp